MDYDSKSHHALYIRTTPALDIGTVEVSVNQNTRGGSTVNVTYQLTALSEKGNERLQKEFSLNSYAQMMKEWCSMIESSKDKIDEGLSALKRR